MRSDTSSIRAFASGQQANLTVPAAISSEALWEVKPFRTNSAVSKMLALMLAHGTPLDLGNGQKIDIGRSLAWSNDKEYHHLFPQAHLARTKVPTGKANVVANIILLTSKTNLDIRDSAPSDYLYAIVKREGLEVLVKRLESNLVPPEAVTFALADDYNRFLDARARHLHTVAVGLAGQVVVSNVSAHDIDDSDNDPTE